MNANIGVRRRLKILILEDEPDDAGLIKRALDRAGLSFDARVADDRASFVRLLEEFVPDVVLADYNLPDFSGLEALMAAQECTRALPFIYVTGSISEKLAEDTILNGAWGFVLKDDLRRLPEVIEEALTSSANWLSWRLYNTTRRVKNQIDLNIEVLSQINEFLQKGKLPDKKMSKKVEESISLLKEISRVHLADMERNQEKQDDDTLRTNYAKDSEPQDRA